MVFSATIFSTAAFLYLFVTDLWQLALVRFYNGFATAIFIPVGMASVANIFQKERGEKIGWFSTSTLGGRFLAPILGGSILEYLSFNPDESFKVVYLVCGFAGIATLMVILRLPNQIEQVNVTAPKTEIPNPLRVVLSDKNILLTCVVEASILFAYGTFETFLPLYSASIGLTAYDIGIFLSAQIITLALTKPLMGRFSDRHGRKPQTLVVTIIGSFCIGSFFIFESFIALLLLSISFGLRLSIVTSATSAFIADLSKQSTTGPIIAGMTATQFGIGYSFLVASLVLITIASLFFAGVIRKGTTRFTIQ